jgi:hypothetical protein
MFPSVWWSVLNNEDKYTLTPIFGYVKSTLE